MSFQGRSPDDLPLAAYSTGIDPDEDESLDPDVVPDVDPDLVAPRPLTQQDLAAALAAAPASVVEPLANAASPRKLPSVKLPSVKLPSLRRSKSATIQQAAPFQPVSAGGPPAPSLQPVGSFQAAPAFEPVDRPSVAPQPDHAPEGAVKRGPRVALPSSGLALRDPRVLAGGVVVIGLALLGISLLGGGPGSGSSGPNGSQDPGAIAATAAPAAASVELTSAPKGIFTLTGATGAGAAVDGQLNASWTDGAGKALALSGPASQGTRTTDPTFVLTWTMLIDNQSVTFTSRSSECTVGMAVQPRAVLGTFICKRIKSGDGRHVLDLRGNYTT